MRSQERRLTDLLEVVDHEEDVGVAHLGLLPFAVHGVLAGRRKHFLSNTAERFRQTAGCRAEGDRGAACSYLTLLLVDVDVPGV